MADHAIKKFSFAGISNMDKCVKKQGNYVKKWGEISIAVIINFRNRVQINIDLHSYIKLSNAMCIETILVDCKSFSFYKNELMYNT